MVPGALRDAEAFLKDYPDTHERINRVTRLVDGFETPSGLELLATVHWVVTQEPPRIKVASGLSTVYLALNLIPLEQPPFLTVRNTAY